MNKSGTFASRLQSLLQLCNITKAELSRRTGISRSSITHYVKGDWEGKQDAVYAIAEATGANEAWLMGYDVPLYKAEQAPLGISSDTTGQRIKSARENAQMTREELANALGVPCSDVEKWEWDVCEPEYETQKQISSILNISIRSIYRGIIFSTDRSAKDVVFSEEKIAKMIPDFCPNISNFDSTLWQAADEIIGALDLLNKAGVEEAIKRVKELTEITRYRRPDTPPAPPEGNDTTPTPPPPESTENGE